MEPQNRYTSKNQLKIPVFVFFAKVMHVHCKIFEIVNRQIEEKGGRKKKKDHTREGHISHFVSIILSFLHV